MKKIVLASASPRRIEMFNDSGFSPIIKPSNIEELVPSMLTPFEVSMYLALQKALSLEIKDKEEKIIIAADTIVFHDKIMGKPKDKEDAFSMLWSLKNKSHLVITGVCIFNVETDTKECFYETTKVYFKDFSKTQLLEYIATDEPYDKAGAYAIQGLFGKYVSKIEGNMDNVIGFPMITFKEKIKNYL